MNISTYVESGFDLDDIFLLDHQKVISLHAHGIFSLIDVLETDIWELGCILKLDQKGVEMIREHAKILSNGCIPVNDNPSRYILIFLVECSKDGYTFIMQLNNGNFQLFEAIMEERYNEIISVTDTILINPEPHHYKYGWQKYLQDTVLLGGIIKHDILLCKLGNQSRLRVSMDRIVSQDEIKNAFKEVNIIIGKFHYVKQFRSSSMRLSSVRSTANSPPRL